MQSSADPHGRILLQLTRDEAIVLNNALNEVCNGVHLSDAEFSTRLGVERSAALELLAQLAATIS